MSSRLLLLTIIFGISAIAASAGDGKDGEDVLRKSGPRSPVASYPLPFNLTTANPRTSPAISTGYYFVDNEDEALEFWRPDPTQFVDTLTEPGTWQRIVSGPRQIPNSYWTDGSQNKYAGLAYFRNPANINDSTNDAFAGPIAIGFPFFFNGVRMDSVYISTNGLIALTNRRYFYDVDNFGFPVNRATREVRPGVFSAYDPASEDNRTRAGDGLSDAVEDNWGFFAVACGSNPANATAGIRTKTNVPLDEANINATGAWPAVNGASVRPQLIAAAWDDLQVSVYNSEESAVDDFSKVYFKRSPANDRFIIYYINLTPFGPKSARSQGGQTVNINFQANNRPGTSAEHYRFNVQVSLNRFDSSVIVQYDKFAGSAPRNGNISYFANVWLRCNSTVGVTGGARRLNWTGFPATLPANTQLDYSVPRYTQSTEFLYNVDNGGSVRAITSRNDDNSVPKDFTTIKFKQYKNMLRVINVSYRIHPLNNNAPLDFSVAIPTAQANNYEMLAGELRLGSIQPVVLVQSLSNDIQGPQGVNYVPQGTNFRVRFRILNEATGAIVYNQSKAVTDQNLLEPTLSGIQRSDPNGGNAAAQPAKTFVLPYEFIKVTFPPFEPNEFIDNNIGRLISTVIAEPRDSLGIALGDQWPFDDTTGLRLFVMRRLSSFNDDVREFHLVNGGPMPSVLKWVNIEADVVNGDQQTNNPPPPRGLFKAANAPIFELESPVIRMNRRNLAGGEIPGPCQFGGDELRSFPINLSRRTRAVLSLSYQRAGKLPSLARGFSDNALVGPEHFVNYRAINGFTPGVRFADELLVEFATPSNDQLNGITNIATWVLDPQKLAAKYTQPFRIWGGGGSVRGYDLADPNLQLDNTSLPGAGGVREDLFDDGKDFEFFKITMPIPDTVLRWVNEGARNFRFRLRARCMQNSTPPLPQDDDDNFFIDNVKILFPDEVTDVEFSNIQLIWPYSMAPASQATRVPIRVKLANNTNIAAPAFSVQIQIKPSNANGQETDTRPIYCRTITIPVLAGNREVTLPFPDINFRTTTPGFYKVCGKIFFPGKDLDSLNDSTFTVFNMLFGPSFAYEANPNNPVNDVPQQQFSGVAGMGLVMRGSNFGGNGTSGQPLTGCAPQYSSGGYNWGTFPGSQSGQYGNQPGDASGQIAMRFTLFSQDTVRGYQAFWGELNQDVLNVQFSLYADAGGVPNTTRLDKSRIFRQRGLDELDNVADPVYGRYVTYLLENPVVLAPGEYWATVGQNGTEGFQLGASASRMGMVITQYTDVPVFGSGNRALMVDKNFRSRSRSGALLNDNRFAYENTIGSGDWNQFTPSTGNPGYGHLNAMGISLGFPTWTTGSWIPLLRPYFGNRSFENPPKWVACAVPVELTYFDGRARSNGVDLFWETASEQGNKGFAIERREVAEITTLAKSEAGLTCVDLTKTTDKPWQQITFVAGEGSPTVATNYKYFDNTVNTVSKNYEYRLRQVDRDGRQSYSNIVSVEFGDSGEMALYDNAPNPSNGVTTFRFRMPYRADVKLEIFDMMGNLVYNFDREVTGSTGDYAIEWNGKNDQGLEVASGSYLYKLTAGDKVLSKTMTIIR